MIPRVRRPRGRRMIRLEVRDAVRVSPSFRRITLGGPGLDGFRSDGRDHTVRLFFPRDGQDGLWLPSLQNDAWMAETLLQPPSRRPWVRSYTVREHRPGERELDIEFVLHGDHGPGSGWAARARPGDPAGVFEEGYGYLPPEGGGRQLLVGDESALPAVLAILSSAPDDLTGHAFLEVPETADVRDDVEHPEGVEVTWLPRDGSGTVPGALALDAVRAAPDLGPLTYAWVAGEAKLATGVRRHLVGERGVGKKAVGFHGYWRHGRASIG